MDAVKPNQYFGTALAIAGLIAAIASGLYVQPYKCAWLSTAVALVLFCAGIGYGTNGNFNGLVIDNRNRVSLSKLQASAWSVIVLSAFLTAAIIRIKLNIIDPLNAPDPIAIDIPPELLAVMGISATSLVVTPIVLSPKTNEPAPPGQAEKTAETLGETAPAPIGKIYARSNPSDAKWWDIFRGDDVSNAASPDLSKLQQFLITVIAITIYSMELWHIFGTRLPSDAMHPISFMNTLPHFSANMAWLIGISHAGYLAYKAAPHGSSNTQTGSSQNPTSHDPGAG